MYKLLIVEDERSTRNWYSKVIDWLQLNLELVAIAEDGTEAWEVLKEHDDIDLVLTDIRMPNMDGLALAKKIREEFAAPASLVIVTGFGEFDYAQQAIEFGVSDYLLKPVTKEQLVATLTKVVARLDEAHLTAGRLLYAAQLQKEQETQKRVEFVQGWLVHKEAPPQLDEQLQRYRLSAFHDSPPVWLFVAEIDDYRIFFDKYKEADRKLCRFMVLNILTEIAESFGLAESVYLPFNRYVFFIAPYEGSPRDREAEVAIGLKMGLAFQAALKRYMKLYELQLSVGAALLGTDMQAAPEAYDRAVTALGRKFYSGKGSVHVYRPEYEPQSPSYYPSEIEEAICKALKHGHDTEGNERFTAFLDSLHEQGVAPASARFLVGEMLAGVFRRLREIKSLPVTWELMETCLTEMREKETFAELKEKAGELLKFILHTLTSESQALSPVARGIEYMKIKLGHDLSLQETAEYAGISPSYFSTLFRQEQGCTFIDYLIRLRMEKSVELLERSDKTIAQIANEIGYMSYRYFIKVFKDYYNLTPTQYRESLR